MLVAESWFILFHAGVVGGEFFLDFLYRRDMYNLEKITKGRLFKKIARNPGVMHWAYPKIR